MVLTWGRCVFLSLILIVRSVSVLWFPFLDLYYHRSPGRLKTEYLSLSHIKTRTFVHARRTQNFGWVPRLDSCNRKKMSPSFAYTLMWFVGYSAELPEVSHSHDCDNHRSCVAYMFAIPPNPTPPPPLPTQEMKSERRNANKMSYFFFFLEQLAAYCESIKFHTFHKERNVTKLTLHLRLFHTCADQWQGPVYKKRVFTNQH